MFVEELAPPAWLSPPIFPIESKTFWPSRRTPIAARTEMLVALRSSRVLITVPSRISRTISSSARPRLHQIPIDLHLAPRPAHNVLAHSTPEEPEQRAFHPPRVGSGQIHRSDQRLGLSGQQLVARQRPRTPFRRPTVGAVGRGAAALQASSRFGKRTTQEPSSPRREFRLSASGFGVEGTRVRGGTRRPDGQGPEAARRPTSWRNRAASGQAEAKWMRMRAARSTTRAPINTLGFHFGA